MVAADPAWINGVALDGIELRRVQALQVMSNGTALGGRAGVVPGAGGLNVSLSGSAISVGSGTGWVYQAGQGMYAVCLPSGATATLQAAHATLPRIDLVYLRVWDNSVDASGLNQADAVYLPGTASSTPAAPTPAGTQIYLPLATINVPASGGGSATVSNAVRPVTVAPGGILPGQTSPPTGLYVGQFYDDGTDLKRWNGSSYDTYQKVETVGWTTPTLATSYTQGDTTTNGNLNGPIRYRRYVDRGTTYMEWDGGAQRVAGVQTANILNAALAVGFRPTARASFVIARNATSITGVSGSTSVVHSAKVDFYQDGTVGLVSATAGDSETTWFSLKGIRYPL
ncbi:hypothetical protein [Streptomyces sp. SCSIO ZS0520]|uniref:hypothetical protein n=1 Tax=Streptomyces sp. SCSIO ZS0520 TaxID=2892996 RepID=UPI0021D8646D|nr:hypothetical protein [Streptomyces sp. SCSIO ZS0520]